MTTVPVEGIHGQTVWDVLLQYYGALDQLGAFAAANGGLAIGEEVVAYQTLQLPDVPATRQEIVSDFTRRQRHITTY